MLKIAAHHRSPAGVPSAVDFNWLTSARPRRRQRRLCRLEGRAFGFDLDFAGNALLLFAFGVGHALLLLLHLGLGDLRPQLCGRAFCRLSNNEAIEGATELSRLRRPEYT